MRCVFAVLLAFLILSCKKEADNTQAVNFNPKDAVGTSHNGVYDITNEKQISKSWEAQLEGAQLKAFEIVKSKTEGDTIEDFYMLVARTEDGTAKVAALLELKENKFYFTPPGNDSSLYLLIKCKGECDGGCLPIARSVNGIKRLICSACADCVKNEIEIR